MFAAKSLFFLIVTTLAVVSVALVAQPAFAGGEPTPFKDHLKCYSVTEDSKLAEFLNVNLEDIFGLSTLNVQVLAQLFCTAAAKVENNGTLETLQSAMYLSPGDFLCYAVKSRDPGPGKIAVSDPFGDRNIVLGRVRMLCAPAVIFD